MAIGFTKCSQRYARHSIDVALHALLALLVDTGQYKAI
jgi:hypothetical protein